MSHAGHKHRTRAHSKHGPSHSASDTNAGPELAPYVGFFLIWIFASGLAYLMASEQGPVISTVLLAAFCWFVVLCTIEAHLGRPLPRWRQGLVRLPLMTVGGGTRPVSAVKGTAQSRRAVLVSSLAASVATILAVILALR